MVGRLGVPCRPVETSQEGGVRPSGVRGRKGGRDDYTTYGGARVGVSYEGKGFYLGWGFEC